MPNQPNILLIMNDDMGYSDLGCYGGEVHTPNLDRLAAGGLRFTQFYNTARCCPTRASILTGLHPHQAGIGHMTADLDEDGYRGDLNTKCVTIAEVLKSAGYATYMSGKWHVSRSAAGDGPKHSWQRQPTPHENWTSGGETILEIMAKEPDPSEIDKIDWDMPTGGVTIEIDPGDAVIWHGNSWHAGWRRELPGVRINLAAYFCRAFMSTQELRGDTRYPEVFERYKDDPRFAQLLGENVFNGWRDEGPDLKSRRVGGRGGIYD